MAVKIKGLSLTSHGFWRYLPPSKGLPKGTPRPKAVMLGTRDQDEAIRMVLQVRDLRTDGERGIEKI